MILHSGRILGLPVDAHDSQLQKSVNFVADELRGPVEERLSQVEVVLARRSRRCRDEVDDMFAAFRALEQVSPLRLSRECGACFLRTARYAQEVQDCKSCGAPGQDKQQHYMECEFSRCWFERCGFGVQPEGRRMTKWAILRCAGDTLDTVRMASALDALNSASDARRHGSTASQTALCIAQLKEVGRRHALVRETIRHVREA